MSRYEDANLILKLYELRREEVMRKARSWVASEFNPQSTEDFERANNGEHSAYLRMVTSYWDMACSFVTNGAIDAQMFNDANGEHVFYFAKFQPFLAEIREKHGMPNYLRHMETVVMGIPNVEARLERARDIFKQMAARKAHAADQSLRV
jgi:hypothetical protein